MRVVVGGWVGGGGIILNETLKSVLVWECNPGKNVPLEFSDRADYIQHDGPARLQRLSTGEKHLNTC